MSGFHIGLIRDCKWVQNFNFNVSILQNGSHSPFGELLDTLAIVEFLDIPIQSLV